MFLTNKPIQRYEGRYLYNFNLMIPFYLQVFFQNLISPETTSYSYELAQKAVQEQVCIVICPVTPAWPILLLYTHIQHQAKKWIHIFKNIAFIPENWLSGSVFLLIIYSHSTDHLRTDWNFLSPKAFVCLAGNTSFFIFTTVSIYISFTTFIYKQCLIFHE